MKLTLTVNSKSYRIEIDNPIDISIPLNFNGEQPNHFGVAPAVSETLETADFIGDTFRGGSCNVESYRLIPHCNGTHTECAGHISNEQISIQKILKDCLIPSSLITVEPVSAFDTKEEYLPLKEENDFVITRSSLKTALKKIPTDFLRGLIIRTLPNENSKTSRNYLDQPPPFFSLDAMRFICELPVQHLMVDLPSVDKVFDEGQLNAHHTFWNIPPHSHHSDANTRIEKTITEMIYIEDTIPDGSYLTNIQIPNFIADAAPSRVFLYSVEDLPSNI